MPGAFPYVLSPPGFYPVRMPNPTRSLAESFVPYGEALGWRPELIWTNAISDLAISLAYFTIAIVLFRVAYRRRDLAFGWLIACFGLFILASGITHVMRALNIWQTAFWLEASIKTIAAILSIPTAVLLWRSLPDVLTLPSRRELRDVNQSLARVNAELEAFTASASHDLRSPLTTIAGQAGLLELSMPHATEEQRRRLSRIQGSVKQMSELIDALLVLSRISRHTLHREIVDASAIAEAIVAELRQNEPGRQVDIAIQANMHVHGDQRLIHDLLRNLIANAWKFTSKKESARIELGMASPGMLATLYIRDNGAGFDLGHAKRLFKPFVRLHSAAEYEGSGLGLATVARIVERHGGKIWAEATVNEGATFYFTLPTTPMTGEFVRQNQASEPTASV
jgi:signal transduction histidine kinase